MAGALWKRKGWWFLLAVGALQLVGCEGKIDPGDTQIGSYTLVSDSHGALQLNQCVKQKGGSACTQYPNAKGYSYLKLTVMESGRVGQESGLITKGESIGDPQASRGLPIVCRAGLQKGCIQCLDVYSAKVIDTCAKGAPDLFAAGAAPQQPAGCTPGDAVTLLAQEVNQILAGAGVTLTVTPDLAQAEQDAQQALPVDEEDRPCSEAAERGERFDTHPRFVEYCKVEANGKKICRCAAISNLAMRKVCEDFKVRCGGSGPWEMALWGAMGRTSLTLSKIKAKLGTWVPDAGSQPGSYSSGQNTAGGSGGNSVVGAQPAEPGVGDANGAGGSGEESSGSGAGSGGSGANTGPGAQPGEPGTNTGAPGNGSGSGSPDDIQCVGSPLVLDLDSDGLELTSLPEGVSFDLLGQGPVQTAWMRDGADAFLVLDRNGNGRIDDGRELFGEAVGLDNKSTLDGFEALSLVDDPRHGGNADGRVTARDKLFSRLALWSDRNLDGVSQPGELRSLAQAKVSELDLGCTYRPEASDRHGNQLSLQGQFRRSDGTVGALVDVFFLYAQPRSLLFSQR